MKFKRASDMKFKIEKGVEFTSAMGMIQPRQYLAPLEQLALGDSYVIPCKTVRQLQTIRANLWYWTVGDNKEFSTRRVLSNSGEIIGVRIWRTA